MKKQPSQHWVLILPRRRRTWGLHDLVALAKAAVKQAVAVVANSASSAMQRANVAPLVKMAVRRFLEINRASVNLEDQDR